MPKSPILSREVFFDKLSDGTLRLLDWSIVNTSLGIMVESRNHMICGSGMNPVTNVDMVDASWNKISQVDEGMFFDLFNTSGYQYPKDMNTYDVYPVKPAKHL
jgi:hypothetical protein